MGMIHSVTHINNRPSQVVLENVLYIPQVTKNLMSPNRIIEQGYVSYQDQEGCQILNEDTRAIYLQAMPQDGMLLVPLKA